MNNKRLSFISAKWTTWSLAADVKPRHSPAGEELEHQDAQRPEVHAEVVAFVEDDLRGHVLRGPTERPGLLATSDLLGKSKVNLETQS